MLRTRASWLGLHVTDIIFSRQRSLAQFNNHFQRYFSASASSCEAGGQASSSGITTSQDMAELLRFIACPLTKAPLRYDTELGKLVCDELGVSYSVVRGVPQLVPLLGEVLPPAPGSGGNPEGEAAERRTFGQS